MECRWDVVDGALCGFSGSFHRVTSQCEGPLLWVVLAAASCGVRLAFAGLLVPIPLWCIRTSLATVDRPVCSTLGFPGGEGMPVRSMCRCLSGKQVRWPIRVVFVGNSPWVRFWFVIGPKLPFRSEHTGELFWLGVVVRARPIEASLLLWSLIAAARWGADVGRALVNPKPVLERSGTARCLGWAAGVWWVRRILCAW